MSEIKITRFNPRNDREQLEQLIKDFDYRAGEIDMELFAKELDERLKDLRLRNSLVIAKKEEQIVGAGFFSLWTDFLGRQTCIVHDVVVSRDDAFKKGIEEMVYRELFNYLKKTMKIDKISIYAKKKGDGNLESVLMKLGVKKSGWDHYEHEL